VISVAEASISCDMTDKSFLLKRSGLEAKEKMIIMARRSDHERK